MASSSNHDIIYSNEKDKTDQSTKKKSYMWEFFGKKNDRFVVCNICLKEFKYSYNKSNMKDHIMVRKHPDMLLPPSLTADLFGQNKENRDISTVRTETETALASFYNVNSSRKKYLDSLFVKMIAQDMQPLRLAEHKGIKEFVNGLDYRYQLPSRSMVSEKLLPKLYKELKLKLFQLLKDVRDVAVT